jgi:eukaryotic-like serine/threonine-protein kinase
MALPSSPDPTITPGTILDAKYRIERELGRGAMGTVWLATHESLGQRVAIKVISPEHANSLELRQRFEREARAAAQLRSRFVVSVFDHGETAGGLPYIVMEYLEGETLEEHLTREGRLPMDRACRIARHVGRGLAKAHSRGIVHRDLKPANIFLTQSEDNDEKEEWTAKVLDFGIAKMDDVAERSTTKTGAVLGTPLFMSPEQVRGASTVDARADLYSLGMVVFHMVTGTYAFEGNSFGDLLVSICTDTLPRLSDRAPVNPAFDVWFAKACARDPALRFQSADEMIRSLELALDSPPSDARSSSSDGVSAVYSGGHLAATFAAVDTSKGGTVHSALDGTEHSAVSTVSGRRGGPLSPAILIGAGLLLSLGAIGVFLAVSEDKESAPLTPQSPAAVAAPSVPPPVPVAAPAAPSPIPAPTPPEVANKAATTGTPDAPSVPAPVPGATPASKSTDPTSAKPPARTPRAPVSKASVHRTGPPERTKDDPTDVGF